VPYRRITSLLPLLAALLAGVLASPVQALPLGVSSWGVPQLTGHCGSGPAAPDTPGLPCVSSAGTKGKNAVPPDQVEHPTDGLLTIGKVDTDATVRASIYDATGIDPGAVYQITKVDGSPGNAFGDGGLEIYDDAVAPIYVTGFNSLGYWRYTGTDTVKYMVVKAATDFGIWDISTLPTATIAGVDYYKWDFSSTTYASGWTGVWDNVDPLYQQQMSHISIYGAPTTGTTTKVTSPTSLLLLIAGLALLRRRIT